MEEEKIKKEKRRTHKTVLFGEEIDSKRERGGGILWGIFLVFAGILLFLNVSGAVSLGGLENSCGILAANTRFNRY